MINIQGPGSLKKIYGKSGDFVGRIPDLLFVRKHLTAPKEEKNINKIKNLFAFVSSPKIYSDKRIINRVKGWCHSFKNPDKYLPNAVPRVLLPESDFIDPMFIPFVLKKTDIKYDFVYFTLNSYDGIKYKGLKLFCNSLKILCGNKKLRGVVVVYFPNVPKFKKLICADKEDLFIINKYQDYLTFIWGKLNYQQMAELSSKSRFVFFPNSIDNSPRTISESLVRNTPIMVFEEIHGGWHYVNNETGCFFNRSNLEDKIDFIMTNKFFPYEWYVSNYGFKKSSAKLAEFVQSIVKLDKKYSNMYFNNFERYLKRI